MRIALDSSVLIAAHISRAGVCAELLADLLLHHELVISDFILEELRRKLGEKFGFPSRDARGLNEDSRDGLFDVLNGGFATGTSGLKLAGFGRPETVARRRLPSIFTLPGKPWKCPPTASLTVNRPASARGAS